MVESRNELALGYAARQHDELLHQTVPMQSVSTVLCIRLEKLDDERSRDHCFCVRWTKGDVSIRECV